MKKRLTALFLALVLCLGTAVQARAAAPEAAQQHAYQAIIALKDQYPEGMPWTNDNHYTWNGGIYSGGSGCAGFAFLLSDAAFGDQPARMLTEFAFSDVNVGDILRVNGDTHSVIVLEVHDDHVVIAEGNFNNSVHWGRTLTAQEVLAADNLITRYPEPGSEPPEEQPPQTPEPQDPEPQDPEPQDPEPETPVTSAHPFSDVPGWCSDAVTWAVAESVTTGTSGTTFSPSQVCANADILTFLWRAVGSPAPTIPAPIPLNGNEWYANAVHWAYGAGLIGPDFDPAAPCTRLNAVTLLWQALDGQFHTGASFSDAADSSAVSWAVLNGITNGTSSTTFSPGKVCSRGEIVTFLYRACVPGARLDRDAAPKT